MNTELLKVVGKIAGIGGLALGVFLLLFGEIIRKKIFPMLPPAEAYRLLQMIIVAVCSVAILGIAARVYVGQGPAISAENGGIAIGGDVSGSTIDNAGGSATNK
ncbi:hypothetical protein [Mesorhizobium sp. CA7]|uniref:hypothetical protein n=1 Tax=Mesorhizobium sp. CA7 TaxID=588501 RepID=UPI001CCCD368|nr:hypothetical protein [Mesorhizobium sp. CA7]MBZ9814751.1 hypothetical protein [Mesorhizobium sp. CA7]